MQFSAQTRVRPTSVEELQEVVLGSIQARTVGSGHSFSRIADTKGTLISLAGLPRIVDIDSSAKQVRISGNIDYAELSVALERHGFALPNLASLPHITVVGACATGTHGSGDVSGGLASSLRGIRIVGADGEVRDLARDVDADFHGAAVALGCFGVISELTLDVIPTFDVRQWVYEDVSLEQVVKELDRVTGVGHSVSVLTRWVGDGATRVWVKARENDRMWDAPQRWMDGTLATTPAHPIPGFSPVTCTAQGGVAGPWHERLPHFRAGTVPSAGDELQSEYLVPRASAAEAIRRIAAIGADLQPHLFISEIRTVAGDDLWLSPAYGRDSVAIHFTWVKDEPAVLRAVKSVELALEDLDARPHWGKIFLLEPTDVSSRYDRMGDFTSAARLRDPEGKFLNDMMSPYFGNMQKPGPP